jgi:phage-related minor tail protein
MATENKKVELQSGFDASGVKTGVNEAKEAIGDLARSAEQLGERASKGLEKIGAGAQSGATDTETAAKRVDAATKNIISSIQRATALKTPGAEKGGASFFEALADVRGADKNALAPYIAQLRQAEEAQRLATSGLGKMEMSAKATTAALRQVPAQFTDIIVSLQGGQAPLTVLLQQGGQLKDVFGGIGPAARALGGYIAGLVSPLTLAAGAAITLAAGFLKGQQEQQAFARTLIETGNAAGVTAGKLSGIADAISRTGGTTQGQAAEVLNKIAASGLVAAGNLQKFTTVAIEMERAGGQAAVKTAEAFAELGKDPLRASIKLNESMNYLTQSTYEQIKALSEQGLEVEAAKAAQEAFADSLATRAPQMEAQLGLVEKAWRLIKDAIAGAGSAIAQIGRADTGKAAIAAIDVAIDRYKRLGENSAGGIIGVFAQSKINDLELEKQALVEIQRSQTAIAATEGERARLQKVLIDSDKEGLQYADKKQKMQRELTELVNRDSQLVNANMLKQETLLARIAAVREKYKEKGSSSNGNRDREAEIDLLNKLAGITSTYNNELAVLDRLLAKNDLSQEKYGEEVRKLVALQPFAVKAQKEINDGLKAEEKALKDAAAANEKYLAEINKRVDAQIKERGNIEEEITRLTLGKEAEEELLRTRLLSQAAALEAITGWVEVGDQEADSYRRLAEELRKTADARGRLGAAIAEKERGEISAKAAKDAAAEWKRTADQIEQSLTDALMRGFESGKDFAKNLRDTLTNLFKTMVLRPIIQGIVQPVAGGINNLLGQGQGGAAGALQQAQSLYGQLSSLYGTVKDYGSQALSFFSGGGASAAGLGGAAASAGGGVSAGALLGDASGTAAASASAASSASYASIYAAIIVAASNAAARDFKNGFNQDSARNIGGALGPLAQTTTNLGDVLRKIGISNEAASILSGETLVSKLFGRAAPQVEGRNIVGNIGSTGFDGTLDIRSRERGGVFRRDRVTTTSEALGGDIDRAIDETTAQLRAQARKYGEALGLPVAEIDSVVRAFNVDVTFADQEEAIKRIQDELSKYGDSLLETFAPALDGVKKLGETTAQTIERVAGSLLSVNEVLSSIGVTSLQTTVAGGTAALALQDLFGGLQGLQTASAAYFNEFFTAEQKQEQLRAQLTKSFAEIGATVPATREAFKSLVESQDLTTDSGRKAFTTLLAVSGAFAELVPVLENTAKSARDLAAEGIERQMKAIADAVGDFGVLDTSTTLSERLTEGRSALEALETGLAAAMGTLSKTILEELDGLIASQKALQSFRSGLGDTISAARLAGLDGPSRVSELKAREAALFGELSTSNDPVAVAQKLQQTILDRISEETTLRQQAADAVEAQIRKQRDTQIDSLRTQITAYSRLQDIARNVLDFTQGLRSSDISPLSFDQQLAASKAQFDASFAGAQKGDVNAASALTGNAKAYLDEARAYFGSSAAYADIFAQVTGSLDALAGTAPTDPQIAGLQAQADALADLNATQAKQIEANAGLVAALEALDSSLALRESDKQKEIDARAKEVADQIKVQKDTNDLLAAQIRQAADGYGRLEEELMLLNGKVARLVGNADLAVAEPS